MKKFWLKFQFRFWAVIDVLFSEKFELVIWKNGTKRITTRFDKKEIDEANEI